MGSWGSKKSALLLVLMELIRMGSLSNAFLYRAGVVRVIVHELYTVSSTSRPRARGTDSPQSNNNNQNHNAVKNDINQVKPVDHAQRCHAAMLPCCTSRHALTHQGYLVLLALVVYIAIGKGTQDCVMAVAVAGHPRKVDHKFGRSGVAAADSPYLLSLFVRN